MLKVILGFVLLGSAVHPLRCQAQERTPMSETVRGTVVSSTADSITIRTESGRYETFVYPRGAGRPASVAIRTPVSVTARGERDGVRTAVAVRTTGAPVAAGEGDSDVVPEEVRRAESQIRRQVRRYGVGVRGGVGFDPELLTAGVQARVGPFFSDSISLRPSAEFGFGEVTTMFALNLEAIYRLPFTPRTGRWQAYVGAGPSFNFAHRGFEAAQSGDRRDIDFGDFDYSTGLSFVTGVEFRNGTFVEMRSMAYGKPAVRVFVGYNF